MENEIKEKVLKGEEYNFFDKHLNNLRIKCKDKCFKYNTSHKIEPQKQKDFIKTIINSKTDNFYINKNFMCNFGNNIFIGDNFYSSFNLIILDENLVKFGDNIYLGPNCTFNTINTPIDINKRREKKISSKEIKVGNNVYFEGSVVISNGITIGDNVIIKAGSQIDKDIPSNSLIEGNPCKIIKSHISFNFECYIKEMINKELNNNKFIQAKNICDEFNNAKFENYGITKDITSKLFKSFKSIFMTQKGNMQNGSNSSVGEKFYSNYNFVLIDSADFSAGNNVLFAPNTTVNTNTIEYNKDKDEFSIESKPIKIGNNVWIASNAYIKGGVTIGDNSTIGARSVVVSDIPENCVAFGNPAKVYRKFEVFHKERNKDPNDKRSEKEISLNEELYFTGEEELGNHRLKSFKINSIYNNIISPQNILERNDIVKNHLMINEDFEIDNNLNVDYGYNVKIGKNFKSFFNLVLLDENEICIGDNVTFGPNVTILCATHPIEDIISRNSELEYAKKVSIGNDVWIKGNTVILPGVKIGNNVIIENGSLINKNIPDNSYASGIPCKVLNKI